MEVLVEQADEEEGGTEEVSSSSMGTLSKFVGSGASSAVDVSITRVSSDGDTSILVKPQGGDTIIAGMILPDCGVVESTTFGLANHCVEADSVG